MDKQHLPPDIINFINATSTGAGSHANHQSDVIQQESLVRAAYRYGNKSNVMDFSGAIVASSLYRLIHRVSLFAKVGGMIAVSLLIGLTGYLFGTSFANRSERENAGLQEQIIGLKASLHHKQLQLESRTLALGPNWPPDTFVMTGQFVMPRNGKDELVGAFAWFRRGGDGQYSGFLTFREGNSFESSIRVEASIDQETRLTVKLLESRYTWPYLTKAARPVPEVLKTSIQVTIDPDKETFTGFVNDSMFQIHGRIWF